MIGKLTKERLASEVLLAGALELRNVPEKVANEEVASLPLRMQPFLYASGNFGPGYFMIKGLVGIKRLIRMLCRYLAFVIAEKWPDGVDLVAGNVTGGMIPGWILSEELEILFGRSVPFAYIRELRKTGGHKELITGIKNNPLIRPKMCALDTEELCNFAQTIINGAGELRQEGFECSKGVCIVWYDNPVANQQIASAGLEMAYLLTVSEILDFAEKIGDVGVGISRKAALADYRKFLQNPLQWQADRGLTHVEKGGTK